MATSADTESALRVQLFDGPRLFKGDGEVRLSLYQSCLLGRVYGSGAGTVSRTDLLSVLWPGDPPPKARRRLNQLLYAFRKKLEGDELFEADPEEIGRAESGVSSDIQEYFEAQVAGDFKICTRYLGGGFLGRAAGQLTREFSDWIEGQEAEMRLDLRRKAERSWLRHVQDDDWEGALSGAEALLALTPEDELRLQRLMEARTKAGQPMEAEEAYREFAAQARENNWEPSHETQILLTGIQSIVAGKGPSFRGNRQAGLTRPPLQGRNSERSLLRRTLAAPPSAELRGILISGEAGIGKTRLIEEVLPGIPLNGHRILASESTELEQLIPLNPLIELFKGREAGEVLRALEEPWRTVLYGVMPSHYLGEGAVPEAPHIQPGSVPRRLFEAFFQLLLSLLDDGPTILVLEDLQWADQTTLSVLEFLIRRWDTGGLQLLISVRTEEIRKNQTLGTFLENLRAHLDFHEVALADLDPANSEALIRQATQEAIEPERVSQVRSLAGGNPFFLIELTLELNAGRLSPRESDQDIVPLPLSIRQVLDRRLSELSTEAETILGSLAVFSRPLPVADLMKISHLPEPDCLSGLDQLHDFRLVATRGQDVAVSHELVRHNVYQGLSDSRRAWIHGQVARLLLNSEHQVPVDELAVHFHHAGARAEANAFSIEAADRAEASGAVHEALKFLRIAREHSTDPEDVSNLIWRMGHLNYLHQNLEEAAPLLELAGQRFRRLGKIEDALDAEVERIDCLAQRGEDIGRDCIEEIQCLKQEAADEDLWEVFNKALDVEAHQLDREGDLEGIREVLGQAKRNWNQGTEKARCKARAMVALNIYFGSPEEGLKAAREAVAIAKKTGDSEIFLYALNRQILVLYCQGLLHTQEGTRALSEAEARLGNCGDLNLKINIRVNRAVWHLEVGELEKARTALSAVDPLVRGTNAREARAKLELNRGELCLSSHEYNLAKAAYEKALGHISGSSPHFFKTLANAGLGLAALLSGDLPNARRFESELPIVPAFWTYDPSIVTIFRARMLMKRQDRPRAIHLLDQVRAGIRHRLVPAWLRLTLEETAILKGWRDSEAASLAREGYSVAEELGLEERKRQFKSQIKGLG